MGAPSFDDGYRQPLVRLQGVQGARSWDAQPCNLYHPLLPCPLVPQMQHACFLIPQLLVALQSHTSDTRDPDVWRPPTREGPPPAAAPVRVQQPRAVAPVRARARWGPVDVRLLEKASA